MTIAPYLDRLSALPPVQAVRVKGRAVRGKDGAETDAEIEIKTSARRYRLWVEHKRVRLTAIAATALQAAADASIVMAPVITGEAATRLAERAINYVDLAGNCHLHLGDDVDVHVEGHRAPRVAPEDRGIRAAGYQALFTYLAGADLAAPVRVIDKLAGVSRQAAHQMRTRLIAEGFVLEVRDSLRWNARRRDDALRRWLEGYVAAVRPRLLIGTYRPRARTPDELERVLTTHAGPPGARWRRPAPRLFRAARGRR